jgi:general secretion pathway protein G
VNGKHRRRGRMRAFTLIELLIVMSILGLLLTMALPRYWRSLDRAKETVLHENLHVLRSTLDKFYADKGRYPAELQELVAQGYLRAVPVDPVTESAETWLLVPATDPENTGISDVRSGALGATTAGARYEDL